MRFRGAWGRRAGLFFFQVVCRRRASARYHHERSPPWSGYCLTPHMGIVESTGLWLSSCVVGADAYSMDLSPDHFPDELRMDWHQARDLRRDIEQEAETYRVTRLLQPEGSPSWEIEVEYRPTGELFCVRWWAEWVERVRTDAGY